MSRSQREEKGGKRVKKEQRPSRRGVRWMFLTCCILAIILLALWQTGMVSSRNFSKSMICIFTYRKELFRKTDRLQVSLWRRRCSPPSPDGLCVQILP